MYWHCRKHVINFKARRIAWPFCFSSCVEPSLIGSPMKETISRSRQQAGAASGNVQMQFFAKDKAVGELESVAHYREAKTLRLREARLAKERLDRASATSALLAMRARVS
jgi:hypothetical protein